jgi:hypothetical protein
MFDSMVIMEIAPSNSKWASECCGRMTTATHTFFQFDYQEVLKDVSLRKGYLHSLLQRCFNTPPVAHGNWSGLSEERSISDGLEANEVYVENQSSKGAAPFWIAFPDSTQVPPYEEGKKQMPDGTKNWIIRAFEANVGGTCYKQPAFSLVNEKSNWTHHQGESPSLYQGFARRRFHQDANWVETPQSGVT